MLIVDELKKNDPQLRLLAMVLASGLLLLLAGLWWVQVVSGGTYQSHMETQSYRTVRMPAMRGKILDCKGRVLAENRPRYCLSLYLDDLRQPFNNAYTNALAAVKTARKQNIAYAEKKLGRSLTKAELKSYQLTQDQAKQLQQQTRLNVVSGILAQMSQELGQPLALDAAQFNRHYNTELTQPYPILNNLTDRQVARFEELYPGGLGVELDLQPVRSYPYGMTAAHLLGYVLRDDSSKEGEDANPFNYYLPDFRGQVGIEGGFDADLRGRPGEEAVLVNNLGYTHTRNVWSQPEAGENVVLTIDLDIQQAAEASLLAHQGPEARAAIVVMNVRTGDVLAMVSSPAINPDYNSNSAAFLADPKLRPQINRATQENYAPGSVFKPVVGLAALENGLNPEEIYQVQADPTEPWHGCIYIGGRKIKDTVPPGSYNLKRAIEQSSNAYFIFNGLRTGIRKIVPLAEKFHFGERTGLPTRQETKGIFPTLKQVQSPGWREGNSADICFGQGEMAVTPIQMAVAYSAIANGGTVLKPRLVERIESQDPASGETVKTFPSGVVWTNIGVSARSLRIMREAMLSETEDAAGTGRAAVVGPEMRICGKTGTAQRQDEHNQIIGWNYWFASFAPYENPKYAVVVMVQSENRGSGGFVCAPIAHDVYEAILKSEKSTPPVSVAARAGEAVN